MDQLEERVRQAWAASRHSHSAILARFVTHAQQVGAVVQEVADLQQAGSSIVALAKTKGVRLCQTTDPDLAKALNLEGAVAEAGIGLVAGPSPETILTTGIGISRAALGVAETGSLLVHLDAVDERLLTMLPEIHVALLHRDAIVDSLEEGLLLTRYLVLKSSAQGRSSYISWITGPSRTADIERVLTIGVHGPKELHIFLLPPSAEESLS